MVIIQEYIQPRILRAILDSGGRATTRDIMRETGFKIGVVSKGGDCLKSRGIVKRKVLSFIDTDNRPRKLREYTFVKSRMHDVHRVIGQMPEGWQP